MTVITFDLGIDQTDGSRPKYSDNLPSPSFLYGTEEGGVVEEVLDKLRWLGPFVSASPTTGNYVSFPFRPFPTLPFVQVLQE